MKSDPSQAPLKDSGNGPSTATNPSNSQGKAMGWLRKLGWAGFLFFLIKGLVWIAVAFGLGRYLGLGSGE